MDKEELKELIGKIEGNMLNELPFISFQQFYYSRYWQKLRESVGLRKTGYDDKGR